MSNKFIKAYWPATVWALIILILTLAPGRFIPKGDYWSIVSVDKYVHAGIFFVQVSLVLYGIRSMQILSLKNYLVCTVLGVLYGIVIEVVQQFIPMRSFDWNDMLANTLGVLAAAIVFFVLEKYIFRKQLTPSVKE